MEDMTARIQSALAAMSIGASAEACSLLAAHMRAVYETNAVLNLTAIPLQEAVGLHVADSAAALRYLESAQPGSFYDLGSGAGYPGIPLSVLAERPVVLVESVKKKAAFLERVSAELRLEATVRGIRAEELAEESPGVAVAVTARALSALPSLCELAAPLLRAGGLLICLKGRLDDDEIERGDKAAVLCGLRRVDLAPVMVPGVEASRHVVVYERTGGARVKLPRRNGLAQRQPLA